MIVNNFVLYSLLPLYLHLFLYLFSSSSLPLSLHQLIDVFAGHLKSNECFEAALQLKSLCGGLSTETVSEIDHVMQRHVTLLHNRLSTCVTSTSLVILILWKSLFE